MIEDIDRQLAEWVENVLGPVTFSLSPPGGGDGERGVSCYLFELADAPPPRTLERTPLQLSLRYLITTWAAKPEQAHTMIEELVFAAMETAQFQVDLDPIPVAVWAALDVAPQPHFVLRIPLRRERPQLEPRLVRRPLGIKAVPLTSLRGRILGPEDIPLVGAVVEIPELALSTRADTEGEFRFAAVPSGSHIRQLRIRARGQEMIVGLEEPVNSDTCHLIRFEPSDWKED